MHMLEFTDFTILSLAENAEAEHGNSQYTFAIVFFSVLKTRSRSQFIFVRSKSSFMTHKFEASSNQIFNAVLCPKVLQSCVPGSSLYATIG